MYVISLFCAVASMWQRNITPSAIYSAKNDDATQNNNNNNEKDQKYFIIYV